MGNLFVKREKKYVKLLCGKCNNKVYIDYKKELINDLYCKRCIEKYNDGYVCVGGIRHIRIEYK